MRLLATAAALSCVLAVLPGSATAKTGKPFDFEVAAPAPLAAASAAGGRVLSRRISTARRFNLVGMRWRGARRARDRGAGSPQPRRGWSRWQQLDAHADHNPDPGSRERVAGSSDPLWVGSADAVQYRLSRRVAGPAAATS